MFDELDEAGEDAWAIYHSHTHSEAYPSPTDRRQAFYPESHYLILSLESGKLTAWRISDGRAEEESLSESP